jgi:hypothetical protein
MFTPTILRFGLMLLIAVASATQLAVSAQTPAGTWELYPAQTSSYATTVQQPINADGTSNFKSNGKAVIPVKFSLSTAPGPAIFQSIGSDTGTDNDFSFASFTPTLPLTFAEITNLSAVYNFTEGDCHGGSLRWQVRTSSTQAVFIYYGVDPNFGNGGIGGCTPLSSGGANQTGLNLLTQAGPRFDLSQYGGPFYGTYAQALTYVGTLPIVRASLVLDSGWQNAPNGDQKLVLTNATVNGNTFVPSTGSGSQTCDLPAATIQITKTAGVGSGDVNEPISIQPNDNNLQFRIVDCKYMYNLATSSLSGAGTYKVEVVINGTPAAGPAYFDLR